MGPFKRKIHQVIFEADTKAGKLFDIILLICIGASVLVVMLETVASIEIQYGRILRILEWLFTILFTIEYILRIISVRRPSKYIFSFFGLVDLLATLPLYISLFIAEGKYLLVLRTVRLLRVFRILKLARYISEAQFLKNALKASMPKIIVFIGALFTIALLVGSLLYIIESRVPNTGFTSLPKSMYWAIVTLTTVGYGDISPQTPLGQLLSAFVMVLGYGLIAVPTGVVSAEFVKKHPTEVNTKACLDCGQDRHDVNAEFCKFCGGNL